MKNKTLLVTTITLFALINTSYYWENFLGNWSMLLILCLVIVFIVLTIALVYQFILSIGERFKVRSRLILMAFMAVVLSLTAYYPAGFIDYEMFRGEDLLVAGSEGAAGCATIIKLKSNHTFRERSVCFGINVTTGDYFVKGDTIKFENITGRKEYYQYALVNSKVLQNKTIIKELLLYHGVNDTLPHLLFIESNKLIQ